MTTNVSTGVEPGGSLEIDCTVCDWAQPTSRWVGHGTPERPSSADYIDAVFPAIGAHIDATGHTVRTMLSTIWRTWSEHSEMFINPRPDKEQVR